MTVEDHRGSPGNGGGVPKRAEVKVRMPEQIAGGVYANSMMVHHTPAEFIMDFTMVVAGNGQVVARVITSPTHMKHILGALADNVRKYEAAHGSIDMTPRRGA
jgi:hypothetical protein